jgi:hypothetical protein
MKSILTLLTAFVLLSSSFTFSSCKDCGKKGKEPAGRGGKTSTEGGSKTISDGSGATSNSNGSDNSGELKDLGGSLGLTQERLLIANELLQFARNARDKVKKQAENVVAQIKKVIDTSGDKALSEAEFCLADKANDAAQDVIADIESRRGLSQQAATCLENRAEEEEFLSDCIFVMPVVSVAEAKMVESHAVSFEIRQISEMLAGAVAWARVAKFRLDVADAARYDCNDRRTAPAKAMDGERRDVIGPLTKDLADIMKKKENAAADAERAAQAGKGIDEANYKIIALAHETKIKIWKEEIDAANARIAKLVEEYKLLSPEDLEGEGEGEGKNED